MKTSASWIAVLLTAAVVCVVSTGLNHAQAPGGPARGTKVAVVNLRYVFGNCEQTKTLNQKMQEHQAKLRQEGERREQEIDTERAALEAFAPDSADFSTRRQKVKKMMLEFRVWEELEKDLIAENYLRWTKRTYQMVADEIKGVAEAKGIDLVVTREDLDLSIPNIKLMQQEMLNRKVVYSAASIDITKQVFTNLNAAFAKAGGAGSVEFVR